MDQRYKTTVEADSIGKKTIMAWQFAQMESYAPPVEGMHQTIISPADSVTKGVAQDYYIQLSSVTPVEGLPAVPTFISPADSSTKVRQDYYLQPSNVAPEGLVFINSSSFKQEGLLNSSAHSSRDDDHVSNLSEDMSCARVKLLSGYGGKILPRPSDGRLRYVGGETRMITVARDVSFSNLMAKMTEVQPQTIAIKYQLPDEDLDALVSVSSDEDLENMMEEYDKLEAGDAHPRLRVFLFTSLDYDLPAMGDTSGNSEQQYLDAVNGLVDGGPRKQSESSTQDISSLTGYIQEATPIAVPVPQLSQGIPVMTRYVPSSSLPALANGAAISPFVTATSFHYAYVDRDSSKQNNFGQVTDVPADTPLLLKADMEPGNRLTEGQKYVIAASTVSTGESGYLGSQEVLSETDLLARKGEQQQSLIHQMQQLHIAQTSVQEAHRMLPQRLEAPAVQHDVGHPEPQKESILGPAFVQWPNEASKATCSSTYPGVGVPLQAHDQAFYFYGNDSLHQGTADMSMWSSPFTSEMKDSDPSLAGQRMSQRLNTYLNTVKGSLLPDQAQTEPISSYEYEALGEKLNLKKPTEQVNAKVGFKEKMVQTGPALSHEDLVDLNLPQQGSDDGKVSVDNTGWAEGVSRSDRLTQASEIPKGYDQENGIDASDRSLFYFNAIGGGTSDLSGWSTETNAGSATNRLQPIMTQMSSPGISQSRSFLEPEQMRNTRSAGSQLSDSLVNFLEDSLHATSSGVSDSCTIHMPHTGSSSNNNMVLDLLTSDDAFCKTSFTSTISGGSTFASSASKSSSYANTPLISEASSVTKFLHENLNAGLLFSVDDDNMEKPQSLVQIPPQVAAKENLVDEVAPLFTPAESFAFNKNDPANKTESAEEKFERCCMSPDTSDLHSAKPREDIHVENVLTEGFDAMLADLPDIPEDHSSSATESEAEKIARDLGFQIIKDGDLEEIRELGSGTFGTVYHGKWRGTDVAVKRIKASCFYGSPSEQVRLKDDFWSEAGILARLHHPNVVAFYGIVPDSPGCTLATVTEFMVNGSLKQVLQRKDRNIDRRRRLLIAMDAAFGMEYLHDKKIIHFDLKGENLLVNMRDPHRPVCKVGDLGLSKIKHKTMVSGGVRGTLPWMAPELLNGKSILVTEKVDVFSFGIVMWELLTGEEPYADLHYGAIIGGIVSNTLRPPIPSTCEPEWRSLMERCWADDPADRPTFSEIVKELRAMSMSLLSKQGQAPGEQAPGAQALTV